MDLPSGSMTRTLTGLTVLLQSAKLKQALRPYCIGCPYGRLLDAESERLGEASVQAFETEGLIGTAAAGAVLAYLFHRIVACDRASVTFRWKDYRAEGRDRQKVMTLATGEFIRRFLIHVLPQGFHRIRHYGLLASGTRADNIARARRLLDVPEAGDTNCAEATEPKSLSQPCPCCGGRMIIIERFQRGASPHYRPAASTAAIRIDTS